MTILSPLAAAIAELLADPAVTTLVANRVRPIEPASGDSKVPFQRFVVLSYLDAPPMPHMGVRDASLSMRAYGTTYSDAEDLWLACESVFRDRGARMISASRLGVYHSQVLGMLLEKDPDTAQPVAMGAVSYPTTIAAVP